MRRSRSRGSLGAVCLRSHRASSTGAGPDERAHSGSCGAAAGAGTAVDRSRAGVDLRRRRSRNDRDNPSIRENRRAEGPLSGVCWVRLAASTRFR